MKKALVSIIVPVYNVEKYLRECLDSLINQTLKDIEIICVNDGSTDSSLSILEDYAGKDSRIKIINKANSGYGHSMNVGISNATGDYIGIVESDDFAEKDMFKKLYQVAEEQDVEVVASNYFEYINNKSTFIEVLRECDYNHIFSPIDKQNIFLATTIIWCCLYKRSFLINNNIKFNETPGASYQDTSFVFKVWSLAKKVYLMKDAFIHYRRDNMDSSMNSSAKIFSICDEYAEIESFLDSNPELKAKLSFVEFARKFWAYRWNYNRLSSAFQYTFLLKMNEEFKKDEKKNKISSKFLNNSDLEEIQCIINDPNKYFKDTAKDYRDERLMLLTLNFEFYVNGFLDNINKYENIILFGAGIIGRKVAKALIEKRKRIFCFAVSDINKNEKKVLDINVFCIDDLTDYRDNSIILVAVKERDQYDIIKKLQKLKFKNIVAIDSILLRGLTN